MARHRVSAALLAFGLFGGVVAPATRTSLAADPSPQSAAILQALRDNPVTAPYRFVVTSQGGRYALSGRVGTKQVHDAAIRTMIALGYPVRDDLTIDTAEVNRVAAQNLAAGGGGFGFGPMMAPGLGSAGLSYVYPPPLFGRLDDPFFGLEPPLVSYPPWFGAMSARREPMNVNALNGPGPATDAPLQPTPPTTLPNPAPAAAGPPGQLANPIELTIDGRGVGVLRGKVPTLADRVAVGQEVARTPGITQVINELEVIGGNARPSSEIPPPPPTPALRPVPGNGSRVPGQDLHPNTARTDDGASIAVDGDPLARRVSESIARRPGLGSAAVRVSTRDGVATLSGHLPSSYEAMLAFRAAQQTPGVRDVLDRMEFVVPDTDRPNPLREKGRPEDVEPYLLAQVRRQLGDLAHVDLVRVRGDVLEIRGTVARADDVARVEAALRSIPVLRGFRLEPSFLTD